LMVPADLVGLNEKTCAPRSVLCVNNGLVFNGTSRVSSALPNYSGVVVTHRSASVHFNVLILHNLSKRYLIVRSRDQSLLQKLRSRH